MTDCATGRTKSAQNVRGSLPQQHFTVLFLPVTSAGRLGQRHVDGLPLRSAATYAVGEPFSPRPRIDSHATGPFPSRPSRLSSRISRDVRSAARCPATVHRRPSPGRRTTIGGIQRLKIHRLY